MVITNWPLSPFSHPCSVLAAAHRRHRRRRRGEASRPPFSVALSPTRRPRASAITPWLRAGPFPPVPRAQNLLAAATATPPWRARRRAPGPLPARARALQRPQRPIPLLLLLSPRSHAIERRRRSTPYSGKLDAAVEPPHRRSSARSDPLESTASPSRNSQTISPRPNLTGDTPPPCSELHRPPFAVDRPILALISRPKHIPRTASTSSPFSPTHPSPPVSPSPGFGRSTAATPL